jgi:type I restriction-modification system DNA methylase subunit
MVNMASDDKEQISKKMQEIELKIAKIEDNVHLLTHIFEEILKEFEKIKKDVLETTKKQ